MPLIPAPPMPMKWRLRSHRGAAMLLVSMEVGSVMVVAPARGCQFYYDVGDAGSRVRPSELQGGRPHAGVHLGIEKGRHSPGQA